MDPTRPIARPFGREGFTLLEVMVALAVLSISLLAVYQLMGQTLHVHERARFELTAALLAQSRAFSQNPDEEKGRARDSGRFEEPFAGFGWEERLSRLDPGAGAEPGRAAWIRTIRITQSAGGLSYDTFFIHLQNPERHGR